MYVSVCICIYIYICMYVYYSYIYIYIYTYVYLCAYVRVYISKDKLNICGGIHDATIALSAHGTRMLGMIGAPTVHARRF